MQALVQNRRIFYIWSNAGGVFGWCCVEEGRTSIPEPVIGQASSDSLDNQATPIVAPPVMTKMPTIVIWRAKVAACGNSQTICHKPLALLQNESKNSQPAHRER